MKLNKKYVAVSIIIILFIVLICLKECGSKGSLPLLANQDAVVSQKDTIISYKTDTIIKVLNKSKTDTFFVIKTDTIVDKKSVLLVDSLHHALIFTNTEYKTQSQQREECVSENNRLKTIQQQKDDSIQVLLFTLKALQKERDFVVSESEKIAIKKEYFVAKNILFTGLLPDAKTGIDQQTIYGGLLKQVLLSVDFMTNIPVKTDNRKQMVYIKISDLQTEQLIYVSDEKPKELYELENGLKTNYSLNTPITFDKNNTANLKITYPMKWTQKRNSAIKVEVFCNKEKIGEQINEIKSGIPVTTW